MVSSNTLLHFLISRVCVSTRITSRTFQFTADKLECISNVYNISRSSCLQCISNLLTEWMLSLFDFPSGNIKLLLQTWKSCIAGEAVMGFWATEGHTLSLCTVTFATNYRQSHLELKYWKLQTTLSNNQNTSFLASKTQLENQQASFILPLTDNK